MSVFHTGKPNRLRDWRNNAAPDFSPELRKVERTTSTLLANAIFSNPAILINYELSSNQRTLSAGDTGCPCTFVLLIELQHGRNLPDAVVLAHFTGARKRGGASEG